MLGTHQILFARLLLDTRGDAGLFGQRLRQLQSRFGQRLARLLDLERRVLARTGQRLLQRVDSRLAIGGDALAVALVFGHQRLESFLFGRRSLETGNGTGPCRMRGRERALQHRDVAAILTFLLQQRQAVLLDLLLELDDSRLSASAICRLRFERLDQPQTLGLVLVGQHRELQPFSDRRFDLITGSLTFFVLEMVDAGALNRVVEPLRLRLVAEE